LSFGRDTRATGSLPPGLLAIGCHSLLGLQSSGLDGRPSEAVPSRCAVPWTSGLGAPQTPAAVGPADFPARRDEYTTSVDAMIISIPLTMQETYAPLASPQDDPDGRPIGPAPCPGPQATRARSRDQGRVRLSGGGTQAVSTPMSVGRLACQYPRSVPQVGSQAVSTPSSSRHHNLSQRRVSTRDGSRALGCWCHCWPLHGLWGLLYR
jgi:hypothetical protein